MSPVSCLIAVLSCCAVLCGVSRLCGELVCRSCTSKLHIPSKFEQKDKPLSRVCHECLFSVLARRVTQQGETSNAVMVRVKTYVWGGTVPSTQAEKERLLPRVFFLSVLRC